MSTRLYGPLFPNHALQHVKRLRTRQLAEDFIHGDGLALLFPVRLPQQLPFEGIKGRRPPDMAQ